MLFNSWQFIFVFLPLALAGFFLIEFLQRPKLTILWLFLTSLTFYGWDDPRRLVPLILISITFNFLIGRNVARTGNHLMMIAGVAGNLLFLAYFKYAAFLLYNFSLFTGISVSAPNISLPIGISFYTFTQIAFLVDAHRKQASEYEPLKYALFITYFPHLIAGPIIHHKEIMPQFDYSVKQPSRLPFLTQGLSWFAIGLFNKVIVADSLPDHVDPIFKVAEQGHSVSFGDAWIGTLAYGLQIYFDFSAYSSMAIGIALMMGIKFPVNFNSPYKADSLIEFWRRWHMTLSRFLRDYLYVPLGGNRRGTIRRHVNLLLTMILGGLWHGATWNFALWGAIHGAGLLLNHLWRDFARGRGINMPRPLGLATTLIFVMFAWVPFRANTFSSTLIIWKGMLGVHGLTIMGDAKTESGIIVLAALLSVALFAPNTQQMLSPEWLKSSGALLSWRPGPAWALGLGCLFGVAVTAMIGAPTVFLYFRF